MSGMGSTPTYAIENFRLLKGPLIDVRSPNEFSNGHIPGAINLPLFSNDERKEIGITYKRVSRIKAIQLGLKYTGPKMHFLSKSLIKIQKEWEESYGKEFPSPKIRLYCWRGGMRSSSIAWLASLIDLKPHLLEGGYKSYRRWVLKQFDKPLPLKLLGGKTGTGKTEILIAMASQNAATIDLEGLAKHRGSSYGGLGQDNQPTNEHFENLLSEKIDNLLKNQPKEIWLEAESRLLGKCRIPNGTFNQMKDAPLVEIKRSQKERLDQLIKIYSPYGKEALKEATQRISKRLGPQRTKIALEAIDNAEWETACLEILNYYDRCYEYELSKLPSHNCIDISGLEPSMASKKLLKKV